MSDIQDNQNNKPKHNNDLIEDDVFYDAEENIDKIDLSRTSQIKNTINTQDDFHLENRETIYEDANDYVENKFAQFSLTTENESVFQRASMTSTSDLMKEQEQEKLRKQELMNEDLKEITVDMEFLKKNLKPFFSKSKGIKDKHLHNLFELQNFQADSQQIWVAKFSFDGKYLATGGKSGVLKIWEIYSEEESLDNYEYKGLISYLKLMNETAFRIYTEHTADIIDICWNAKNFSVLLTASLDHNVILWDVKGEYPLNRFTHSAMVSSASFCPNSDEYVFVSGCFDKIVRIWNPVKNKVTDYINVQEYITSVSFFPTGDQIAVGSHTGRCSIYEANPKLKYSYSFDCKNKTGKYADGRKITNLEFLNKNNILVTTNDSSIRLVNVNDGKTIQKYKGLVNDEYMIRGFFEEIYDLIISASDDGNVYVWKKINPIVGEVKNKMYEYFRAFEKENSTCSTFLNDIALSGYIRKVLKVTQKFFLKSTIINTSNSGKLQVIINTEI